MIDIHEIKNDLERLLYIAGKTVKDGYNDKNKDVSGKRDANDLLTKYDIEVNTQILQHLEEKYPDISIISEEAQKVSRDSEYAFVVDPIDGTRNFVRHIPIFFVGIGLVQNNKPIFSITYNPITDEMFSAIKGEGTYCNGERITVSDRTLHLSDIIVRTLPDKRLEKEVVSRIVEEAHQVKNNMCCHEELSGVACNRYDGFVSKGSSPWDYCHGLLVEEAGGRVTNWEGGEFDITQDNIVASNGVIHDDLLRAVK